MFGVFVVKEAFFFDGVELIFPRPPTAFPVTPTGLAGAREAGGGRFAGMGAQGGVGVGVGRGAQWALERARVEGVGGLFAVVGVARWALHVVDGTARGSGRRRLAQAAYLGVGLGQYRHCKRKREEGKVLC